MKRLLPILLSMALGAACDSREERPIGELQLWKRQTDALKKAKQVDQLIQDSVAKKRRVLLE